MYHPVPIECRHQGAIAHQAFFQTPARAHASIVIDACDVNVSPVPRNFYETVVDPANIESDDSSSAKARIQRACIAAAFLNV